VSTSIFVTLGLGHGNLPGIGYGLRPFIGVDRPPAPGGKPTAQRSVMLGGHESNDNLVTNDSLHREKAGLDAQLLANALVDDHLALWSYFRWHVLLLDKV
jgi:hypothetical protein